MTDAKGWGWAAKIVCRWRMTEDKRDGLDIWWDTQFCKDVSAAFDRIYKKIVRCQYLLDSLLSLKLDAAK